jgi:hypothetical protein
VQNARALSGVQPHTFAAARLGSPPPQVCPVPAQVLPQLIVRDPPQRSVTTLSPQEPTPQLAFTS